MFTSEQIPNVLGHTAFDPAHHRLGKVGQVFVDDDTGAPEWVTLQTGRFGTKQAFVPVEAAEVRGDEVVLPYSQDKIARAPRVTTEAGHLAPSEEARLYEYYGVRFPSETAAQAPSGTAAGPATPAELARERPATEPAGAQWREAGFAGTAERQAGEMIRREEHLRIDKELREAGRARLHKYTTTEYEQQTVPLRKERIRIEREPITEEDRTQAAGAPGFSEEDQEVILQAERPVVSTESVAVERVRMQKEAVIEEETVGGEVHREHIESEVEDRTDRAEGEWRSSEGEWRS